MKKDIKTDYGQVARGRWTPDADHSGYKIGDATVPKTLRSKAQALEVQGVQYKYKIENGEKIVTEILGPKPRFSF